ncbi:hypothetical protein MTBPR1_10050 [Candidatus Terasakiella magnetica]|uniref:Uncharacterized protein n=1 Tax=Candidatus Terasakiella magnetica TaxID=1867952 RepID=A0A1C3RBZ7_9PROT|nr:hypothetical protein MTBPR1_10050 [Candidatus Terasakiella magnetica]
MQPTHASKRIDKILSIFTYEYPHKQKHEHALSAKILSNLYKK